MFGVWDITSTLPIQSSAVVWTHSLEAAKIAVTPGAAYLTTTLLTVTVTFSSVRMSRLASPPTQPPPSSGSASCFPVVAPPDRLFAPSCLT